MYNSSSVSVITRNVRDTWFVFRYYAELLPRPDYRTTWFLGNTVASYVEVRNEFHSGFL